ncbi:MULTISPECIES: diacylglycerol kinase family protein [unclassified Paenibacillus]|uniref:diacylglycerol/lipid kinase family protein n=1 Tax=unclassified Paenibacillus TaxID=185978 RepID=UPI001C12764D|nr:MULTISPECIES: diacylglycerol kinase family protein [unclassified Paenibacillus]MBU5441036.1 diacylglycerol kinase family lipid kinase [Paenibacillus sp. MSJ-34]CAH0117974.1 Diacylglycerol kinase [Paenibacillus sp. CECT 9249]
MYFFVINRQAGNGNGMRVWRKMERTLRERNIEYRCAVTDVAEQARMQVREALAAWPLRAVAVIGGDGTIRSVLPELSGRDVPLAVIPAGSGNDTARGFGIPRKPLAALEVLLSGRCRRIDLIGVDGERSVTALAVGFDAAVAEAVNNGGYKKWCNRLGIGRVAYIIGIMHTLIRFRPAQLRLELDGERTATFADAWMAAVANVATYGGGLRICPQAQPDDGLLDVCVVHGCTKWQLLRLFPTVLQGRHTKLPYVTMLRAYAVSVSSELPRIAYGDGEPCGATPLSAQAEPQTLLIVTP